MVVFEDFGAFGLLQPRDLCIEFEDAAYQLHAALEYRVVNSQPACCLGETSTVSCFVEYNMRKPVF